MLLEIRSIFVGSFWYFETLWRFLVVPYLCCKLLEDVSWSFAGKGGWRADARLGGYRVVLDMSKILRSQWGYSMLLALNEAGIP